MDLNQGPLEHQTDALESTTMGDSYNDHAIFDEIIQLLLRSKVAKAESCLIGGYHDERIELTYYIETLLLIIIVSVIRVVEICNVVGRFKYTFKP